MAIRIRCSADSVDSVLKQYTGYVLVAVVSDDRIRELYLEEKPQVRTGSGALSR